MTPAGLSVPPECRGFAAQPPVTGLLWALVAGRCSPPTVDMAEPVAITCCLSSQTLREWVAVESDSVQPLPRLRRELLRMMAQAADKLRHLGATVASVDLGSQQVLGGPLPLGAAPLGPPAHLSLGVARRGWPDPRRSRPGNLHAQRR